MDNMEKRYERQGRIKPCSLSRDDLVQLSQLIQETFTKPEVERYFRVSTTVGDTRVFSHSMEDFINQPEFRESISSLSFWIEGWEKKTRFDKNVLLDFSKYSIQLHVSGTDPVWVYDKFNKIAKFLNDKTVWYWPVIISERLLIFSITVILITNILISLHTKRKIFNVDKLSLLIIWFLLVFYDTRKIWPYSNIRLKDSTSILTNENIIAFLMIAVVLLSIISGTIMPYLQ